MSREEAINIISQMIKDEEGFLSDNTVEAHKMAIKALEPTTKNDLGVDKARSDSELIARGDVINMIKELPSVKPQEPKIVLMAGDADKLKELVNKAVFTVIPQSKTGHWIHRENMDYLDKNKVIHNHFMCQDCGFIHDFIDGHTAQYKYCPNCGARMVEPQESEE